MSNIKNYFEELNNAQKNNDPNAVIEALQNFFTSIAKIKINQRDYESKIIGIYMTARQLEKNNLDTSVIKETVYARVMSGHKQYPANWRVVVDSLNQFFVKDGFEPIKI